MGVIISRFRKKSSVDKLEDIEQEIKEIQACNADSKLRHKQLTRSLMMYSSLICASLSIFLYFYMPPKLQGKLILLALLIASPLLYYIASSIISWYYDRKIKSSHSRLNTLKKEKKQLLDEIMEKETYKVAKDILEKYAPDSSLMSDFNKFTPVPKPTAPMSAGLQISTHLDAVQMRSMGRNTFGNQRPPMQRRENIPAIMPSEVRLPQNKSYIDKIFDYVVGDGPNNRYALICSRCSTHNGMALMEEFEYTAFKCYACHHFNPARKERPVAPKLENGDKSDESDDYDERFSGPETTDSETEDGKNNAIITEVPDEEEIKAEEIEEDVVENKTSEGDNVSNNDTNNPQ